MSFESDVITKYGPLFNGRLWFGVVPSTIPRAELSDPFCLVNVVGGRERVFVDNTLSEHQNARLQFSIWGDRVLDVGAKARELRKEVVDSFAHEWMTQVYGAPVSDYDDALDLHGTRQDFGIWYIDPLVS